MTYLLILQLLSAQSIPFLDLPSSITGNNLLPNVLAYYRMEEVGNPLDSAYLNHLTMVGSSPTSAGKLDLSKTIGGGNYFWMPDNDQFDPGTGPFTAMYWIKFTQDIPVNEGVTMIAKWNYQSTGSWIVNIANSGVQGDPYKYNFSFNVMYTNDLTSFNYTSLYFPTLSLNSWYCIGVRITGNAGGTTFNLNIRKENEGAWWRDIQNSEAIGLKNSNAPITVNGLRNGTVHEPTTRLPANTYIDELAFWNRSLSDCEMDKYFNLGLGQYLGNYNALPCQ